MDVYEDRDAALELADWLADRLIDLKVDISVEPYASKMEELCELQNRAAEA